MIHQTFSPKFPLSQYISHFTYYRDYRAGHRIDRFLPDGNIEIVMDLTDQPKYIYDNESLQQVQACNKISISGTRNKPISIPSGNDTEMFIIHFRKGMVYPFLQIPLAEITDLVIDGDLILQKAFLELRDELRYKTNAQSIAIMPNRNCCPLFGSRLTIHPAIEYAIHKITVQPECITVKQISLKTGYSAKHFIALFKQHLGVTPKTFQRIIRFQKAIHDIELKGNISWTSLALDCGYFDQAHFIADFKNYSGFTPAEYLVKKNGLLNYVPVA